MEYVLQYLPYIKDLVVGPANITHAIITAPGDVSQPIQDVAEGAKRLLNRDQKIPSDISAQMTAIQDRETDSEQVFRLQNKIEYSHNRLIDEARRLSQSKIDGHTTTESTLAGLWSNPVGLTEQDRPSEPIYNIIATILSRLGISPVYKHDGEPRDVTEKVARVVFERINPQNRDEIIVERSDTIKLDQGSTLTVSHVFYTIRLGVEGDQYMLLGAINLSFKASNEHRIAMAKVNEICNYYSQVEPEKSWLVTLLVRWATAPTARNAQHYFKQILRKKYPQLKIRLSAVQGVNQILKVQGPLHYTPEAIRTAVQDSAQNNVEIQPPRHDSNQIPLTAQNVLQVIKLNEINVYGDEPSRHSSWVDCVAER